jgi:SH3 domain-containing protein
VKRLLISLCLIGGVAYLFNAAFLARTSPVGGTGEKDASSHPQVFSAEMAETSASPDPGPSPSGPRNSPHAISVDQPPSEEVDAVSSSPPEKQEQPTSPATEAPPLPQAAEPANATPGVPQSGTSEFVRVTSRAKVRNGPGASNKIIGTAHPGAVARVLAHDSGWVQIRDPASSNTGWISSDSVTSLGETTDAQSTASDQKEASAEAEQDSSTSAARPATKHRHASVRKRRHWRGHIVIGPWRFFHR